MKQIKIFKQETSKSCGVACIRSILNYYGNNFSEKDIWNKHKSFGKGDEIRNPILSLGLTALKFGFKVKYVGYNPIIANNNSNPKDLKKSLKIKSKSYFSFGKFYVNTALNFLEFGGEMVIDKLNVKKLKKIIDKDKFFLVEIRPAFINKNSSLSMNHKVIVIGYNNKGFIVLNPSNGAKWLLSFDDFLLSFYSAVPEILIIKNKEDKK
jgi:Peptidase C39 family